MITPASGKVSCKKREKDRGGGLFIFADSGLLLVILLGGAWYDIREQRIPNWWCICACMGGLVLTWIWALPGEKIWQMLFYTGRILLMMVIWFPLFWLRMVGAGDIKLMALMAGYLGWKAGATAVLYGFFIGALLAFLKMLVCRNLRQRLMYFLAYIRRFFLTKEPMPYYLASRDGKNAVIPLGFCMLAGYLVSRMQGRW